MNVNHSTPVHYTNLLIHRRQHGVDPNTINYSRDSPHPFPPFRLPCSHYASAGPTHSPKIRKTRCLDCTASARFRPRQVSSPSPPAAHCTLLEHRRPHQVCDAVLPCFRQLLWHPSAAVLWRASSGLLSNCVRLGLKVLLLCGWTCFKKQQMNTIIMAVISWLVLNQRV